MDLQVRECSMCHKVKPAVAFSQIDANVCTSCASKALRQARIEDDSWLEQNKQAGIELWEHQPQEPQDAFNAWVIYRDAYPKQLKTSEIADIMGRSATGINYWRKRWKWDVRWDAWALEQDRIKIQAHSNEIKDMNKRQISLAQMILAKAALRVEDLDMAELTPKEVSQWIETAAKLERSAVASNGEILKNDLATRNTTRHENEAKPADSKIGEVLSILQAAGALGTGNIEVTTTKETTTVKHNGVAVSQDSDESVDMTGDNIIDIDYKKEDDLVDDAEEEYVDPQAYQHHQAYGDDEGDDA